MSKRSRILIVDDDVINLQVLLSALHGEYDVVTALSGTDAISRLKERAPDLILLDVMMPDISGFDVCRIIKAEPAFADIPIIFLTALNSKDTELQGLELGGIDYLTKPVNLLLLKVRVRNQIVLKEQRDLLERQKVQILRLNDRLKSMIRERTNDLHRLNRDLEEFCYAISHEFRAPIARIEGFGTMLLESVDAFNPDQARYSAERIIAASTRLRNVIDSLLQLSRLTRSEISTAPVNLSRLCTAILSEFKEQNPGRAIHSIVAPEIVVTGDSHMLEICLRNLLGNALKYSSKKAESVIEFGVDEIDGIETCFVKDNGVGFDMAFVKNIFVPFCRLHAEAEFEGSGVGLATVHRIIEKHNGRIWADAKPYEGATFYFTLDVHGGSDEKFDRHAG